MSPCFFRQGDMLVYSVTLRGMCVHELAVRGSIVYQVGLGGDGFADANVLAAGQVRGDIVYQVRAGAGRRVSAADAPFMSRAATGRRGRDVKQSAIVRS
jgi:hypothetical protein